MGQDESKRASEEARDEKIPFDEAIAKFSDVELGEIGRSFSEIYEKGGDDESGRIRNREDFAKHFHLPVVLGDRLFEAFDRDRTGSLTFREFAAGLSVCLKGSLAEKRALLFTMFNLNEDDEGVSPQELATLLNSTLKSAYTILNCASDSTMLSPSLQVAVEQIVKEAFEECDISKNGKLLPVEFEYWLSRNSHLVDSIFGRVCPEILAQQEQNRQKSSETSGEDSLLVAEKPATTTDGDSLIISEDHFRTPKNSPAAAPRLSMEKEEMPKRDLTVIGSPTQQQDLDPENSHCYWPPSENTKQLLNAYLSGGISSLDSQYLTSPGISIEGPYPDPISELLKKYGMDVDALRRQMMSSYSVVPDSKGFQTLVAGGHYRAALDLTGKFLAANGQGMEGRDLIRALHTHKTLQVWFCRFALLCKLKMFNVAHTELEAFHDFDQPDLYFEYHPDIYPEKKGSLVPFSFRLLAAELPQYLGKQQEALDKLYRLLDACKKVLGNLSGGLAEDGSDWTIAHPGKDEREVLLALWNQRKIQVLFSIGNCFVNLKEYRLAVLTFESLVDAENVNKVALLSGIGRLRLQLGDIEGGKLTFDKAEQLLAASSANERDIVIQTNRAFVCVALGQYDKASVYFRGVTKLDSSSASAVNNLAVCLLYQGRLKEALTVLEEMIWKNPDDLHESILFNLCTAYELESSKTTQRKKSMLELAAKYCTDAVNAECLKLGQ
ncbi:trafficking protein particle complex subunit 12-like [Oscarella lobularis]|uniref:trafficking protein particle complex subunit 12-like n=1 Tax=Oscarella lobularis TaxID=121494 RepID=UPI0033135492